MNKHIAFVVDAFPTHVDVTWSLSNGELVTLTFAKLTRSLRRAIADENIAAIMSIWDEELH